MSEESNCQLCKINLAIDTMNIARQTIKRGGGMLLSLEHDTSMDDLRLLFLNLLLAVSSTVVDSLMTWVIHILRFKDS